MAIVTPLLLTLLLGIIEYGYIFTVKQTLVHAAREGARTAALPGSTDTEIQQRIASYMQPVGLIGYSVELTRATADDPTETVHVSIPYADVTLVGGYFGSTDYDLGATCSMRKEGMD
jgi:Flp pilus assembly protein TadG